MSYHFEETQPASEIFRVGLEMLCKMVDPLRKESNLDFRGTRVPFMPCMFLNDLSFSVLGYCAHSHLFLSCASPASQPAAGAAHGRDPGTLEHIRCYYSRTAPLCLFGNLTCPSRQPDPEALCLPASRARRLRRSRRGSSCPPRRIARWPLRYRRRR